MKIATWNVNSIGVRAPQVLDWWKQSGCDVLLLQELKCTEEAFPRLEIESADIHVQLVGQKTYNGVAVLSRFPFASEPLTKLPTFPEDEAARYIETTVKAPSGDLRVASVYVPNGQSPDSDKFPYKLKFLEALHQHLSGYTLSRDPFIVGGDYNVAPSALDVYAPKQLEGTTCFHPEERKRFHALTALGFLDSYRLLHPDTQEFSWWDYRAGGFQQNKGMRIDHLLCNAPAADRLTSVTIDRTPRGNPQASDHTPVIASFA